MTPPSAPLAPVLALVFNALVWGLSWWPLRELQRQGMHPLWASAVVFALALVVVLPLWRARTAFTEPGTRSLLLLLGLASGLTNLAFNWAVTLGDVIRVVLLFYLMPAWAVLLAWLVLGERPTAAALLRLLLALGGVAMVLGADAGVPLPRSLADWLGLAGGLAFAVTNVLLRRLAPVPAGTRLMAMFAGCALLSLGVASGGWLLGALAPPGPWPAAAWALAAGLAGCFLLSNLALQFGAARLPAQTTALVMLSEVVFASVSSVLLDAAELGWRTLAGGALILAAAAWSAWPARQTN